MFSFGLSGPTIHESVTGETLHTLTIKEDKSFSLCDHHWA